MRFTRPEIGARFMCTSNTLMKIDTRVYSPSSSASGPRSSGGGGTFTIIVIRPSAGATMNLSPRGVHRIAEEGRDPDRCADAEPAERVVDDEVNGESDERRRHRELAALRMD